jgi:hypothetical protein
LACWPWRELRSLYGEAEPKQTCSVCSTGYRIPVIGRLARFGNWVNRRLFGIDPEGVIRGKDDPDRSAR